MTVPSPSRVFTASDLLKASSANEITSTLTRLRSRFRRWKRWLTQSHQYLNVVAALQPRNVPIDGSKLAEYVACSSVLHLVDGWVYLSRAFDAMKLGDKHTAAHLAYYAELRAAMSLLATEGIGVFNDRHVALGPGGMVTDWTNNGGSKGPRVGTHWATWALLNAWGDDASRAGNVLTSIAVERRSMAEWLQVAGVFPSVQHVVARSWLKSWSIDLNLFPADRDLRNRTSYRPSRLDVHPPVKVDPLEDMVNPLLHTWDALEPAAEAGGAVLDHALLYGALRLAFNEGSAATPTWDSFLDRLSETASSTLIVELKSLIRSDYYVLSAADDSRVPPRVQAVLARATLLLRLANGLCAQQLKASNIGKDDIRFWWARLGADGGMWSDESEVDPFSNLWAEVNEALAETQMTVEQGEGEKTVREIAPLLARSMALSQFTRAPFWLLGVD